MFQPTAPPSDKDLSDRAQVHDLVVDFYREIVFDDLLGPVFEEVAEVDWTVHLPRLIDFWCRVLLGEPGYDGHVLSPHKAAPPAGVEAIGEREGSAPATAIGDVGGHLVRPRVPHPSRFRRSTVD